MRIDTIFKPVQVEPWELILLRVFLLLYESQFPKLLRISELMHEVNSGNIREFISFTAKTLKQYKIKIKYNDPKYSEYRSIEDFEKLKWSEDSAKEILDRAETASFLIEFGKGSISKIRSRIRQLIEAFIKDESLFLSQIGINSYTYSFQKSNFLDNIQSYFRKYGLSFRLYSQTDYKIFGEEQRKINFLACLLALEYEGYIKIEDLSFSHTENSIPDLAIKIAADDKLLSRKITPPRSWQLIEEETKAHIRKGDQIVFSFPSNTSNKYRYFKCIWNNYGNRVLYKDIYEFESNLKYPDERGKKWHANDLIRNTVRKLKKEFLKKELPFNIATNRGFVFTIQTEG